MGLGGIVGLDRAGVEEIELAPYRAAFAAGVKAVITAHILFPSLEPEPGLPPALMRMLAPLKPMPPASVMPPPARSASSRGSRAT